MTNQATEATRRRRRPILAGLGGLMLALAASCGGHTPPIPNVRPMVNFTGARVRPSKARMDSINEWVTQEQDNITKDPTFMVMNNAGRDQTYPWEHMRISNDTVAVYYYGPMPETVLAFQIYGHLHLMAKMGRQAEWLPEAPAATGFDLERAILARVSDAWLLARTVYDVAPYGPLDELVYAKEAGYLDAFIFTARPDQFAEARAKWAREQPDRAGRYRAWFVETFNREPPGLRAKD